MKAAKSMSARQAITRTVLFFEGWVCVVKVIFILYISYDEMRSFINISGPVDVSGIRIKQQRCGIFPL
jgi:hypothetical protein